MEIQKLLDLENDGLNMAADGRSLYVRCKRMMYKFDLADMNCAAKNVIFKKDGKARSFSIGEEHVFLTDFCDLYILGKDDLQIVEAMRLGADLSSDLGAVRFDAHHAYISIRNGKMAVMDLNTRAVSNVVISNSSSWDFCVAGTRIYTGTVNGEIVATDTHDMQFIRKNKVCKKNIYSVVYHNGMLYTVSQDTTIKIIDAATLEVVCERKAVKGMVRILGMYQDLLVVADGGISLWHAGTLALHDRFAFPTGQFNKGAVLYGSSIIGSDCQSIYRCQL